MFNLKLNYYETKKCVSLSYSYYLKDYIKRITGWDGNENTKPRDLLQQVGIELIKNKMDNHNLVLITGVGKSYPLVRSHTILNNLHSLLDKVPVIMFYSGMYDQKELSLFNGSKFDGLKDDNYYRAFRLVAN